MARLSNSRLRAWKPCAQLDDLSSIARVNWRDLFLPIPYPQEGSFTPHLGYSRPSSRGLICFYSFCGFRASFFSARAQAEIIPFSIVAVLNVSAPSSIHFLVIAG